MWEQMRAALFDMDGLMLDTERVYYESQLDACRKRGYQVNPQKLLDAIGTQNFDCLGFFCGHYPKDLADPEGFLDAAMEDGIQGMLENGVPIKPGVRELLTYLRDQGIQMIVATSTPRYTAQRLMEKAGLFPYFEGMVTTSEAGKSKPAPDIFLKSCEKLGVQPADAVVFEDSVNGCIAAIRAHIPYVLVPDMVQPTAYTASHALMQAHSLNDVLASMRAYRH